MILRYTREKMGDIWEEENKFSIWLKIETFLLEYLSSKGKIPREIPKKVRGKAKIDIQRIKDIEKVNRHEVIAFVESIIEQVGEYGKFIHYGLTSSDLMDTALSCQIQEAGKVILGDINELLDALKEKAIKYKNLPIMGRTHGMHAEPITLGLKFLRWFEEVSRDKRRFLSSLENARYGKISGAVGTYSHLEPEAEKFILSRLGLEAEPVSSQILPRDRFSEIICTIAIIGTSLEEFSLEIRSLQRTEIGELEEPFTSGQKGSSAMPHKRNPILSERICGLARILRGNSLVSLENIPLWHERDISHSSAERIIIPDSFILLDYLLSKFTWIIKNLRINEERIKKNLNLEPEIFSQNLMLVLIEKGMDRVKAYELTQEISMKSKKEGKDFFELVKNNPEIKSMLKEKEIKEVFSLKNFLKHVNYIFERNL